jgi:hypothetical protein
MADRQRTHSRKRRSRLLRFPEIKGKTVEAVEIDTDAEGISIVFSDKTVLSFDLDPAVVIFPQLSDFKTGSWRGVKQWPSMQSRTSMVKWL